MNYFDHAATSWPKPPEVARAMAGFLECAGGNPGRSGHRLSIAAARIVYAARESLAELFNAPDPMRVIFACNATHALNLALRGLLRPGDRVVTTSVEHNSVMRPLRALASTGIDLVVVPCAADGSLGLDALARAVVPGTRLVVAAHASNVTGTLQPLSGIARIAHHAGALLLVDAAQSAGAVPIDVQAMDVDLLAFTGHKGLQGPPGTGGLIVGERVPLAEMEPLMRGGTGSHSEFEAQPDELPDRFESGTPNGPGIAGLGAGVRFLMERGIQAVREHEVALTRQLLEGLRCIPRVKVYGPVDPARRTATLSLTMAGHSVSDLGLRLDEEFDILCRVGLHCAPAAHRTIGTFPDGTVRLAPGIFTTAAEVEAALAALERLARE